MSRSGPDIHLWVQQRALDKSNDPGLWDTLMDDAGYMVEQIDWFRCTVPGGVVPLNQDGEVTQFALLQRSDVLDRLQRDAFTTEAALVLVAALGLG